MIRLIVDPAIVQDYPALAQTLGLTDFQPVNGPATPYGHNVPAAGYFVMRKCNGDPATFIDGPLTPAQVAAIAACPTDTNAATVRQKITGATSRRNTFLAIANPTNAQILAEMRAIDRDLNGLTRLLLGQFDTAADT